MHVLRCAQVDVSRAIMVSVLWAIASVRIAGGCLATSLVIYLFASLLTYVARLMVIPCACMRASVPARVCARLSVQGSCFLHVIMTCVCEC